jgi:penicillin amidase
VPVSSSAIRVLNLSIAVLLAVFLAAGYWFAWRPLPETSGDIQAPISAPAAVSRDALGVPHISAASWQDAMFLQGYVTAQDRLWQMDALRRFAAGELAEIVGPSALDSDREARRMMLPWLAQAQERALPAESRAILAAYARGVNYFLETHRERLPLEFTLLNYQPRPWRPQDSILVALQMYRTLTPSWRDELRRMHLTSQGDAKKTSFLYATRFGSEILPGSNAWAISGRHTASGKPILANDPHLEYTLPSTWYLVHLKAPDLDVTGASLPGIPAVIIGHNRHIAWGVTNLGFDVQDLYHERIDLRTGKYLLDGKTEQAQQLRDVIPVKGARPLSADFWITRHGPVFLNEGNQAYALRWMAWDQALDSGNIPQDFPFLDLNRAQNWAQFNSALKRYPGPAQNFVYADDQGNIGYHAAGFLPARQGCNGEAPTDDNCRWTGIIPYEDLPQVFNPPDGIIVTANQNPFPRDFKYAAGGMYAPPYRAQEIRALLSARHQWKAEDMLAVQKDVYSSFGRYLAQQVVLAFDRKKPADPKLREAVDVLRPWNGQMEKGTAAPQVSALLMNAVREEVAHSAAPKLDDDDISAVAYPTVERLLRERPEEWFADYDAMLLKALGRAIEEGVKAQGSKVGRWDYGQSQLVTIANPVAGQLPLIGRYFNIGPVPMSGSGLTIKQTTRRLGPSMRMIVDFGALDGSLANITIGQSGQRLSKHYKDQWELYYTGHSVPMQFDHVDARETLKVHP